MEADRRATRRFPLAVQTEIQKIGDQSTHLAGTTRDFSTAGAFIYLNRPIAEGSSIVFVLELTADITLSESTHIVCEGRVIRTQRSEHLGAGIAVQINNFQFFNSL